MVVAIVSMLVDPDRIVNELGWSATVLENGGIVTDAADAIVLPVIQITLLSYYLRSKHLQKLDLLSLNLKQVFVYPSLVLPYK